MYSTPTASLQAGTRAQLRGPFFKDYKLAIQGVNGWKDGDNTFTNYIGHPMMGSTSGFIYLQNDPRGVGQEFGKGGAYWKSRLRAMGWSTAYSAAFENRGAGAVDLVITPTRDAGRGHSGQAFHEAVERKTQNRYLLIFTGSILNPGRAFAK